MRKLRQHTNSKILCYNFGAI
uniref:Uncharacterized protein n=1 Tax=Wuchereria bancrofti TaxID=6293 RepID=A0A1I8EYJ0_WUCBA